MTDSGRESFVLSESKSVNALAYDALWDLLTERLSQILNLWNIRLFSPLRNFPVESLFAIPICVDRPMSANLMLLIGRSTAEILCSVVYLACRLSNTPRSIQDISEAANIKKKALQRIYRMLLRELDDPP